MAEEAEEYSYNLQHRPGDIRSLSLIAELVANKKHEDG